MANFYNAKIEHVGRVTTTGNVYDLLGAVWE
jgi:hypothetical protein